MPTIGNPVFHNTRGDYNIRKMKKNIVIVGAGIGISAQLARVLMDDSYSGVVHIDMEMSREQISRDIERRMSDMAMPIQNVIDNTLKELDTYVYDDRPHPNPATRKYKGKNFGSLRK